MIYQNLTTQLYLQLSHKQNTYSTLNWLPSLYLCNEKYVPIISQTAPAPQAADRFEL